MADRARTIGQQMAELRSDRAMAVDMAHQAQVREALTRTELTLALNEAMAARAACERALREQSVRAARMGGERQPLARYGLGAARLRRLLMRLGVWGQAQVIARTGVWRGDDAGEMASYVRRVGDPTAQPATLFDPSWYLASCPEAVGSGLAPLLHYLVRGGAVGASPHPLFDPVFYDLHNASDLRAYGITALEHFVRDGAARGRDPHPLFDLAHYGAQRPQLTPGEDPVSHYARIGWREGLSPHPLFDPAWYRSQMPRQAAEVAPLTHYVTGGWREGLTPHPLFDPAWYLAQNPDVRDGGEEPLAHFLTTGAAEGRAPSPWFDVRHYVAQRGAALDPAANPLVDYLQGGAWAVAEARPGFPSAAYLAGSPELARQGLTPLEHWARKATPPRA